MALLTGEITRELAFTMSGFLLFNLGIFAIELTSSRLTDDARTAAQMILKGRYAKHFWASVLVGRVVPLIILFTGLNTIPLWIVMAVLLAGILVTEHIWIRAPQLIALS